MADPGLQLDVAGVVSPREVRDGLRQGEHSAIVGAVAVLVEEFADRADPVGVVREEGTYLRAGECSQRAHDALVFEYGKCVVVLAVIRGELVQSCRRR